MRLSSPCRSAATRRQWDAVSYWLYDNGYDDSIEVEFVSAGTLATTSVTGHSYLAEDGTVTYYQGEGGADTKYVTYTGVQFKLSKLGAEKTVTANVRIGWDVEKAQELMQKALDEQLTWEAIRGETPIRQRPARIRALPAWSSRARFLRSSLRRRRSR